jgi:flagellar M-ring protein FliF
MGVGFELFDRTSLGVTEFVQRNVNWRRANEGELQRTISSIDGVESVRVHLVFPEDRIFREDQRQATASVVLNLSQRLSERSINGIVNIIANSVEGLDPSRVTIVDQNGRVLNESREDNLEDLTNNQLRLQAQIEDNLTNRAQSMLDQAFDVGNSVVRVTATLNFDQIESTSEIFDPDGQVVRSEEIQSNTLVNLSDSLSNVSEHQIINYEISTTQQRRINQVGDIRRLTVAVNVNYRMNRTVDNGRETLEFVERSPSELAQVEALVRGAVGFDVARGDEIFVHSMLFDRTGREFARSEEDRQAQIRQYIAYGERGAVIVVLIVLLFILMSQFKKVFAQPEPEEVIVEDALRPAFADGIGSEGFYPEGDEGLPMGDGKITYTLRAMKDIQIEQTESMLLQEAIQKFVFENPEVAVKLIKSWIMDKADFIQG